MSVTTETENQDTFAEPELYFYQEKHLLLLGLDACSFSTGAVLDAASTDPPGKMDLASACCCPHEFGMDAHLVFMLPTPPGASWDGDQQPLRSPAASSSVSKCRTQGKPVSAAGVCLFAISFPDTQVTSDAKLLKAAPSSFHKHSSGL